MKVELALLFHFLRSENRPTGEIVLVDLSDRRVEVYYYPLLVHLSTAYHVVIRYRFGFLGSFNKYYHHLKRVKNISVQFWNSTNEAMLLISDRKYHWHTTFKKIYRISFDVYSKQDENGHIMMPFPMHPNVYDSNQLFNLKVFQSRPRRMKLTFSGNLLKNAYANPVIHDFFNLMNRLELVDSLRKGLSAEQFKNIDHRYELKSLNDYCNKFILMNWSWSSEYEFLDARVPDSEWFDFLSGSDFFLAAPGVRMPYCQNIIEAMSVGTIPIIQFNKLFDPPLIDQMTCISFYDQKSLLEAVEKIMSMSDAEISIMRRHVISYYENHLSGESFVSRLRESPDGESKLLIHATTISHMEFLKGLNHEKG